MNIHAIFSSAVRNAVYAVLFLLIVSTSYAAAADVDNEIPLFKIKQYNVEGNTLIAKDKLEGILRPFAGKGKDFGDWQTMEGKR